MVGKIKHRCVVGSFVFFQKRNSLIEKLISVDDCIVVGVDQRFIVAILNLIGVTGRGKSLGGFW